MTTTLRDMRQTINDLVAQRDELVTALQQIIGNPLLACVIAHAALAKVQA